MTDRSHENSQNADSRLRILKQASWAGILGNLALAGLKIFGGLVSGSLAVVGDGIDSLSDVVTSMVTLYAAKAAAMPPDPEHPWGHGRVETIATKTLSLIIIMAGLQLIIMTFRKITGEVPPVVPESFALWAAGISIVGKFILAVYKYKAGKRAESQMMLTDALNMRNDIILSLSVIARSVLHPRSSSAHHRSHCRIPGQSLDYMGRDRCVPQNEHRVDGRDERHRSV